MIPAIQAANQLKLLKTNLVVWDVIPLDVSVNLNDETVKIVSRNTSYPTRLTKCFWSYKDFSDGMDFKLFQGDILLGDFRLAKITETPDENTMVDLTFAFNADGILDVNATLRSSTAVRNIKINTKRILNQSVMERMALLKQGVLVGKVSPIQRNANVSELEGTLLKHAQIGFNGTVDNSTSQITKTVGKFISNC